MDQWIENIQLVFYFIFFYNHNMWVYFLGVFVL